MCARSDSSFSRVGVSSSTLRERVLDCLIQMNIDSKKGNTGDKVARFMIELIKKEFRLE